MLPCGRIAFRTLLLGAAAAWYARAVGQGQSVLGPRLLLQDLLGFAFWIVGFFGNTILWRGPKYKLLADGPFEILEPPARAKGLARNSTAEWRRPCGVRTPANAFLDASAKPATPE